jgi:uncharacterized protein (UPF0128 family)
MAKTSSAHPGAGMGKLLSSLLTDAVVKARAGIIPHEQAERWRHNQAFMETAESELAPLFNTMFAPLLEYDDCPDALRAFINEAGKPTNQTGFLLQMLGFMGAILALLPQLGSIYARSSVYALNRDTLDVVLSPADAADAVMRAILTPADGEAQAANAGVGPDVFGYMTRLIGEPPAIGDMAALWRRGDMELDQFISILAYSRINPDYLGQVLEAASSYMSPADVIELAIKGVAGAEDYQTMFRKAGGYQGQFEPLFLAAGDAVGNEQVLNLYNHGLASYEDVISTFGRSRMNPIFYPLAFKLRHKWLAPFQVGQLVQADPSLASEATQWLIEDGYAEDQVAGLIAARTKAKVAHAKTETEALVTNAYIDQILSWDQAQTALTNLGYDAQAADLILALADAKRAESQRTAAVTAIRSAYLAQKIDRLEASADLDHLEIPPAARDQWLAAWDVEQSTKFKTLTSAQIGKLAKDGIITFPNAMARWVRQGYSETDARLLAYIYGGLPVNTTPIGTGGTI